MSQTLGQRFHFVPGYDVSGVVDALSDGVSQWAPGDAVYGMVNFLLPAGACAEYVVADAGTWRGRRSPFPLAHARWFAACGPHCLAGALFDVVACNPVSGFWCWRVRAVSAIFLFSLLHGKALVSATASPANHDFLRRHGAALALDYRDPVAVGQHGPWDLILI